MSKKKNTTEPVASPSAQIVDHYIAGGWNIYSAPKNSINDLIATNGTKHHFIQIIAPDDVRLNELAQNTFIQNAFSNGAMPIHATAGPKVALVDVNTRSKVLIRKKVEKSPAPVKTPVPE